MVAGCFGSDPDAPLLKLSELLPPTVVLAANSRYLSIELEYDARDIGGCAVLDASFQATVDGTAIPITERGVSGGSVGESDPCAWPMLRLDNPPVGAAAIAMSYPRHTITVDLEDLLAPRSAELVPDGPWTFAPGQAITLRWSPISDLSTYKPTVKFVTGLTPQDLRDETTLPFTVTDDQMSFTLPPGGVPGHLDVTLQSSALLPLGWPSCAGAHCQLQPTPAFTHPIVWRQAAAGPTLAGPALAGS